MAKTQATTFPLRTSPRRTAPTIPLLLLLGVAGCTNVLAYDDDGEAPSFGPDGIEADETEHDVDLTALEAEEVEDLYEATLADPEGGTIPEGAGGGGSARPKSDFVYWDGGNLRYRRSSRGDRILDFSHAGYGGGGVRLPRTAGLRSVRVRPSGGDDCRAIQNAIDEVGGWPKDDRGMRGVVQLAAGRFQVRGGYLSDGDTCNRLRLTRSGVVLRGEGSGPDGTHLVATRVGGVDPDEGSDRQRLVIQVGGPGSAELIGGTRQEIEARVATGSRHIQVADPGAYRVGQRVLVRRRTTRDWIDQIGMDSCGSTGGANDRSDDPGLTCLPGSEDWYPWVGRKTMDWHRRIARIDLAEGRVVLDAPITMEIAHRFGGGFIQRYTRNRVQHVGIERLRGIAQVDHGRPDQGAWNFIHVRNTEDGWIRNVVAERFVHSTVTLRQGTSRFTVQDSAYVDPVSVVGGGRRYAFDIDSAEQVLVQRCRSERARHAFVVGSLTSGPNVFLDCKATQSLSSSETHNAFSTGVLYDNVRDFADVANTNWKSRGITLHNESRWLTTDHGWSAGNSVMWNARATRIRVESPPSATNWCVGCRAGVTGGQAEWDRLGTFVRPHSLYLAQLRNRLGPNAVRNITE